MSTLLRCACFQRPAIDQPAASRTRGKKSVAAARRERADDNGQRLQTPQRRQENKRAGCLALTNERALNFCRRRRARRSLAFDLRNVRRPPLALWPAPSPLAGAECRRARVGHGSVMRRRAACDDGRPPANAGILAFVCSPSWINGARRRCFGWRADKSSRFLAKIYIL